MTGTYNGWLVLLSAIVSITASFVALNVTSSVAASHRLKAAEHAWLAAGAVSMGMGIWSMHFIGMLGWRLPIPVSYDIPISLASFAVSVAASWIALYTATRDVLNIPRLLVGGLLMGTGIAAMHYIGMYGMLMQPPLLYDPWLFSLSVAIAIAVSILALQAAFRLKMETIFSSIRKKTGSAILMGGAIYGMHYTAMAATIVAPDSVCMVNPQNFNSGLFALALGSFTMFFLVATLLISAIDAHRASRFESLALQNAKQLVAAVEEREWLARDLHDNIVQVIYAIGMRLEQCQRLVANDQVRTELAQIIDALNDVIRKVRQYIAGSQQALRGTRQLSPELAQMAEEIQSAGDSPRFQLDVDDIAAELLGRDETEQVLSIAREALSNSLRHSHAQQGTVALRLSERGVQLEIRDDGVGFDPRQALQKGGGLRNMRRRARQIDAGLEILSSPGQGTRIVVTISKHRQDHDLG